MEGDGPREPVPWRVPPTAAPGAVLSGAGDVRTNGQGLCQIPGGYAKGDFRGNWHEDLTYLLGLGRIGPVDFRPGGWLRRWKPLESGPQPAMDPDWGARDRGPAAVGDPICSFLTTPVPPVPVALRPFAYGAVGSVTAIAAACRHARAVYLTEATGRLGPIAGMGHRRCCPLSPASGGGITFAPGDRGDASDFGPGPNPGGD